MEPLVVIVGTTASGKSALAMRIAKERNGEIIAADSRTIYKGMDIGTAKPSPDDQKLIPHHLIDVAEPDRKFTASDFKKLANRAIKNIHDRGKLPIMVGGTGLYIDSILYDFSFRPANPAERQRLEKLTVSELQTEIRQKGLEIPENTQNPRHLIRVLETNGEVGVKNPLRANTEVIGVQVPDDVLKRRIAERTDHMIAQGLQAEVKELSDKYGWEAEAMKGIGYREWQDYFAGSQDLIKTKKLIVKDTWQYARRQRTWFRRSPDIDWQ
ncbi:MAG: tRNA (adenosine(37)-N6)-dimethylallyltransferase MiaA [Candidatus Saccharibacteria bacterium]